MLNACRTQNSRWEPRLHVRLARRQCGALPLSKPKKGAPKDAPCKWFPPRAPALAVRKHAGQTQIRHRSILLCPVGPGPARLASVRAPRLAPYSTPQACLAAMRANVAVRPALMPVKLLG